MFEKKPLLVPESQDQLSGSSDYPFEQLPRKQQKRLRVPLPIQNLRLVQEPFLRCGLKYIPPDFKMLDQKLTPLTLAVRPTIPLNAKTNTPVIVYGDRQPIRCENCRSYIAPSTKFLENGNIWVCGMCEKWNDVPKWYKCSLNSEGLREDLEERPELTQLNVIIQSDKTTNFSQNKTFKKKEVKIEMKKEKSNSKKKPIPYVVMIDTSIESLNEKYPEIWSKSIEKSISALPKESKLFLITFDQMITIIEPSKRESEEKCEIEKANLQKKENENENENDEQNQEQKKEQKKEKEIELEIEKKIEIEIEKTNSIELHDESSEEESEKEKESQKEKEKEKEKENKKKNHWNISVITDPNYPFLPRPKMKAHSKESFLDALSFLIGNQKKNATKKEKILKKEGTCYGSALLISKKILSKKGGRILSFLGSNPTIGVGSITKVKIEKETVVNEYENEDEFGVPIPSYPEEEENKDHYKGSKLGAGYDYQRKELDWYTDQANQFSRKGIRVDTFITDSTKLNVGPTIFKINHLTGGSFELIRNCRTDRFLTQRLKQLFGSNILRDVKIECWCSLNDLTINYANEYSFKKRRLNKNIDLNTENKNEHSNPTNSCKIPICDENYSVTITFDQIKQKFKQVQTKKKNNNNNNNDNQNQINKQNNFVHLQIAISYRRDSNNGNNSNNKSESKRDLRLLNLTLEITQDLRKFYSGVDLSMLLNFFLKRGASQTFQTRPEKLRYQITKQVINILTQVKLYCSPQSKKEILTIPKKLSLLPIYCSSLIKNRLFRENEPISRDEKAALVSFILKLPVSNSITYIYPRLIPLVKLPSLDQLQFFDLSSRYLKPRSVYLLEDGFRCFLWIGWKIGFGFFGKLLNSPSLNYLDLKKTILPKLNNEISQKINTIIEQMQKISKVTLVPELVKRGDFHEFYALSMLFCDSVNNQLSYPNYLDFLKNRINEEIGSQLNDQLLNNEK
ncbi:sec24-related protein [Anaeramoeba flamelloides]|uniref:Sec24-related protein n=1 Tax=Anaeramoeba flamelloides TaxID=1746091 RepID=A0AAV7ZHP8_9EUKA|nr:sec24-related protein [Anaeramoeba flamelloides]